MQGGGGGDTCQGVLCLTSTSSIVENRRMKERSYPCRQRGCKTTTARPERHRPALQLTLLRRLPDRAARDVLSLTVSILHAHPRLL